MTKGGCPPRESLLSWLGVGKGPEQAGNGVGPSFWRSYEKELVIYVEWR
jgi:hypothetical protein